MHTFSILRTVFKKNLIKLQEGTDEGDSNSKLCGTHMGTFPLRKDVTKVEHHDRALQSHAMICRIRHRELNTPLNTGTWVYEIRWQFENEQK